MLIRIIDGDCPALSATPEAVENAESSLLEGQSNGHLFRYDDMCTPCPMGTVVFSNTGSCSGVLKTLALITRNDPVRLGARGLDGGRGPEPGKDLLAILYLTEGPKAR